MDVKRIAIYFFLIPLLTSCLGGRDKTELKFDDISRGNLLMRGEASLGFDSLKKYILRPKCMSCHAGPDAEPSIDRIDFSSYDVMMKKRFARLVKKGNPEGSRLYKSFFKDDPEERMPPEGSPTLNPTEIQFIYDWIKACAPEKAVDIIPEKCPPTGGGDDDGDDDDFGDDLDNGGDDFDDEDDGDDFDNDEF